MIFRPAERLAELRAGVAANSAVKPAVEHIMGTVTIVPTRAGRPPANPVDRKAMRDELRNLYSINNFYTRCTVV